jgi:hypothetical protein
VANFEVVQTTGPAEGPRSPGAPIAHAGGDLEVIFPGAVTPNATVSGQNVSVEWTKYAGPGAAVFSNAAELNPTVTFSRPGIYTLMLHVRDGVHAVARDAVVVNVVLPLTLRRDGNNVRISFPSAVGQTYRIERSFTLQSPAWSVLADSLVGTGSIITVLDSAALGQQTAAFYRAVLID